MSESAPLGDLAKQKRAATLGTLAIGLLIGACLIGGIAGAFGIALVDRGTDVFLLDLNNTGRVSDVEMTEARQSISTGGFLMASGAILYVGGLITAMALSIIGLRQNAGSRTKLMVALIISGIGVLPPVLFLLSVIALPLLMSATR